jgi:carboxynorspermidine decarboxylase
MQNYQNFPTPAYICEEELLKNNIQIIDKVAKESGLKILMALKGFALWKTFPLISPYIVGTSASGLHEAILGKEEIGKEIHTYSPAFNLDEIDEVAKISTTIIFNSISQFRQHYQKVKKINPKISIGLRVNPQFSTTKTELYDPCSPYSRLGITLKQFNKISQDELSKINGLHFHALCEQNIDDLEKLFSAFESKFGKYFANLKWINMGGGHLITKKDYKIQKLIDFVKKLYKKYPNKTFYIEPSEAFGWGVGFLIAEILDIIHNGIDIAILNTSAEAHMPDVLAMPYQPKVRYSGKIKEKKYNYRLTGNSCLAGDIIGDYSFDTPLKIGDKIIFEDMIHYSIVKNTTFNGLPLPTIGLLKDNGNLEILKTFNYQDYKGRLS